MLAERAGRQIALAITVVALLVMDGGVCQNTAPATVPAISLHPTGGVHIRGDPVTLSCMTTTQVSSIEWFKDDQLLGTGPQFNVASFSESQTGNYTCRATTNGVGTVTSAIARLQLAALEASPPGTFNAPHSVVAEYNQPWVLSCGNLTSVPPATYNWGFQNFIPFIERDHAIIGKNDGLLYLQLVMETPPTFVCTVNNAHIHASRTGYVQLTVQGNSNSTSVSPQVMMSPPQDTVAVEGDTVSLQCIVGGHPVLSEEDIEWTHPNETQPRLSQQNAILTIISVTTADAGQYACYATGLGRFIATLTVLVPPVISTPLGLPQSPIFGDPLTLSCIVSNTLVGKWVWYHNAVPLPVHTATSNTLVIGAVDTSHGGLYQCFAYNAAGNDSSVTSVNVTTIPAKLTETIQPPSSLVFEGSNISYRCKAHGAPPPSILWLYNGVPADIGTTSVDPETREATSSVELSGVSERDSGQYVCRAVNQVGGMEIGRQETQATLVVIVPTVITTPTQPLYTLDLDKPGALTCQSTAQEGAELQFAWEKDGVQLVTDGIRVSLSPENRSTTILFSKVVEEDSGIYQCKVTTMFGGITGPSVESIPIDVTASPEELIPPEVHPITDVTATSFKVSWYYPGANAQAKLESYTVSYRIQGKMDEHTHTQPITGPTDYKVTQVKPYMVYVVRVWADYKSGEREGSEGVLVMTSEDVPGAPGEVTHSVVNTTAVLVEWEQPEEPNGIITNYTLRYRQQSSNTNITLPLSNITEHTLSPLLPKALYVLQVAASTAVGLGPFSEPITVSTDEPVSRKTTAIYEKAWFIAIAFVVCVVVVLALFLAFVGGARLVRKRRQKYRVRSRDEVETMKGRHARSLTEEEMADYNGRASRRSGGERSELSVGLALDGRESESSAGEKYPYEPSLSTTVSHISSQAPAYINPPPFEEAIRRLHTSRLPRAYSNSGSSTLERPPPSTTYTESEFGFDSCSKTQFLEASPSPPHSYHTSSPPHSYHTSSPLHSSPLPPHSLTPSQPPPPHPPPPPPVPQSPTHSEHKYASVKELGHNQRSEGMMMMSHPTTPTPTPNGYMQNANGYNALPTKHMAHKMYMRSRTQYMLRSSAQNMRVITQPQLAKTSSQPNFATFV